MTFPAESFRDLRLSRAREIEHAAEMDSVTKIMVVAVVSGVAGASAKFVLDRYWDSTIQITRRAVAATTRICGQSLARCLIYSLTRLARIWPIFPLMLDSVLFIVFVALFLLYPSPGELVTAGDVRLMMFLGATVAAGLFTWARSLATWVRWRKRIREGWEPFERLKSSREVSGSPGGGSPRAEGPEIESDERTESRERLRD